MKKINSILDHLSEYFAHRKGLLPILGLVFVMINFILQLIPGIGWLTSSNLFLHFGVILAIVGMLLAWVL
jgi:uncharacterized membrane protein